MKTEINEAAINMVGGSWKPEWSKTDPAWAPMWKHVEHCRTAVRKVYAYAAEVAARTDLEPGQRWAALKRHVDEVMPTLEPGAATAWARARIAALRRELTPDDPADHRQVLALRQANPGAQAELEALEKAVEVMTYTRNAAVKYVKEALGAEPVQGTATAAEGVRWPRDGTAHLWNWTPPR
ncbi:MAG: hypothetical protein M3Z21_13945 [Pseudomonadota bacterium]|nr:hypothetical protein [Pseudomonadota bacterium]